MEPKGLFSNKKEKFIQLDSGESTGKKKKKAVIWNLG